VDINTLLNLAAGIQVVLAFITAWYGYRLLRLTGFTRTFILLIAQVAAALARRLFVWATVNDTIFLNFKIGSPEFIILHHLVFIPLVGILFTAFVISLYYDFRKYLNGKQ